MQNSILIVVIMILAGLSVHANDGGSAYIKVKGVQPFFKYTINNGSGEGGLDQPKTIVEFSGDEAQLLKKALPKQASVPMPGDAYYDNLKEFANLTFLSPSSELTLECKGGEVLRNDEGVGRFIPYPEKARCRFTYLKTSEEIYSDPVEMCCGAGFPWTTKNEPVMAPLLRVATIKTLPASEVVKDEYPSVAGYTKIIEFHSGDIAEFMHIIPIVRQNNTERVRELTITSENPAASLKIVCVTQKSEATNGVEERFCRFYSKLN